MGEADVVGDEGQGRARVDGAAVNVHPGYQSPSGSEPDRYRHGSSLDRRRSAEKRVHHAAVDVDPGYQSLD